MLLLAHHPVRRVAGVPCRMPDETPTLASQAQQLVSRSERPRRLVGVGLVLLGAFYVLIGGFAAFFAAETPSNNYVYVAANIGASMAGGLVGLLLFASGALWWWSTDRVTTPWSRMLLAWWLTSLTVVVAAAVFIAIAIANVA